MIISYQPTLFVYIKNSIKSFNLIISYQPTFCLNIFKYKYLNSIKSDSIKLALVVKSEILKFKRKKYSKPGLGLLLPYIANLGGRLR